MFKNPLIFETNIYRVYIRPLCSITHYNELAINYPSCTIRALSPDKNDPDIGPKSAKSCLALIHCTLYCYETIQPTSLGHSVYSCIRSTDTMYVSKSDDARINVSVQNVICEHRTLCSTVRTWHHKTQTL